MLSFHSSSSMSSSPIVFSISPSDCLAALVEYNLLYTLLWMRANRHITLKMLNWPSLLTRGIMPTLSGGISLGSSTFMSSSSCIGGLPDRRQILDDISPGFCSSGMKKYTHSLSNKYAIQKTLLRCSTSTGFKLNREPRLCRPILCESLMAAATRKNDGWGLGVPCKKSAYLWLVRKEHTLGHVRDIPFLIVPEHSGDPYCAS